MSDERCGKPSASSMERVLACPGSFLMEAHLGDTGNRSAANRGTKIHAALEGSIPMAKLSHSDRICVERISFEEAKLVEQFSMEGAHQLKEVRLWHVSGEEKIFSGQPDIIHYTHSRALVINYKTGHYPPTPINKNVQMETEGALAAINVRDEGKELTSVAVALIHPNCTVDGKVAQAHTYSVKHLLYDSVPKLDSAAREALKVDAPRRAGPHCEWCRGKKHGICPENRVWSKSAPALVNTTQG